ncbi:GTPase [Streptomyces fradiae]|uniref:YfjP family GTPase n=1 Tax=Streptomyces fradiae TaxID=1906 RepID=UPI003F4CAF3F
MTAVNAVGQRKWDDGLIARRAAAEGGAGGEPGGGPGGGFEDGSGGGSKGPGRDPRDGGGEGAALKVRLDALRDLLGLSATRLDPPVVAEAGRVLAEAAARQRLSSRHTVIAIAGATGSGKSTLINALAGVPVSETGLRRPTTAAPIACAWSEGAAGLLDRLGIPGRLCRRPLAGGDGDEALRGLVLVDLPDHDSALTAHRDQVDRVLGLVDGVIWVVDPEKYADAALHERYLRPLAGHAEVTFVVLNQIDRLLGDTTDQVLDDLRRLLDEDGVALGEHGEPGATVLALSALTGEGLPELREALGTFVRGHQAATRRLSADVDAAATRLRPVYVGEGRPGLGERSREDFTARLAVAVGAAAAGEAAERAWRRNAGRACGTPWLRLWRWYERLRTPGAGGGEPAGSAPLEEEPTARQRVEHAVRVVAEEAAHGLPAPWAQAVREAAARGARGLPEALDELAADARAPRPGGKGDGTAGGKPGGTAGGTVGGKPGGGAAGAAGAAGKRAGGKAGGRPGGLPPRPAWWPVAVLAQASMTLLQVFGALWLAGQIAGVLEPRLLPPVLVMLAGIVGGPLVEWACVAAARGPARRYGQETERRLREAAAGCGRAMVLDPIATELMRYREVREQYATVSGGRLTTR